MNLGLRYELPSPYTEIKNRQTLFIPGRQSTVFRMRPGLLYPGDKGVPAGLIPTYKRICSARGLCLGSTGSSKWLVTSAYGIFYEPYYTGQGGPLQSPISAPPYSADCADQLSSAQFCQPLLGPSVQRQPSSQRPVRNSADQFDDSRRTCLCPTRRTGT